MYFALTAEQRALQDTVRRYLAERFPLAAVRASCVDAPDGDGDPPELWRAAAEQGWLSVLVPERQDGMGLDLLDAAVIARCWGEGVAPGPFLPTLVAAEAVRLGGSDEQHATWLPKVAAGQARLTPAFRHAGGAWSPAGVGVRVRDGVLTGTADHVEYAHVADRLVAAAATDADTGEVSLWLVDPSARGVTVTRHDALDRTTRLASVRFDAASGERLARSSADVLVAVLDRAAVLYANDLAGVAAQALSRTVDHAKTRVQFGRPIGAFQALAHQLADLHVATTMAGHAGWYAAHALDQGLPDAPLAVSVAKAKASDTAREVTAAMIQVHGGIGYTWEHDAHLFFKRAKREEYQYGDAAMHREHIARIVVDRESLAGGD